MKKIIVVVCLTLIAYLGNTQELGFQVSGLYTKSVKQEQLLQAECLKDLNPGYPSSWINKQDYVSAEISINKNGVTHYADGIDDQLNKQQLSILHGAEMGNDIEVNVHYRTKNAATSELEIKTINFKVTVIPESEAEFKGGKAELLKYLQSNIISKIPESLTKKIQLASVQFHINEEGKPANVSLTKSSESQEIDELLLKSISEMPSWRPAQNSKGEFVRQIFTFSVGNLIGC